MAIQDVVHGLLTANGYGYVVGTKIGCTTKVMQDYLGVPHPVAGGIFDTTVRHRAGEFDFDSFLHVGVECEIAVRLHSIIPAGGAPHSVESASEAVAALFPAIEIVDDRYVDFVAREPDWRTWLADDFFGAGAVLGEPITEWRGLDLAAVPGSMRINGIEVGSGHGRDIINGHPLEALVWLANAEAARGRDLPADWIVMLGSIVQTKWVAKGDLVAVEIEGLGATSARFA
jgi:2-oxo-3-hexenedioate decarboxylase/2-keto-4-pentenoate hydratase